MDNRTLPIEQAAAGDQEAFAILVSRMTRLIHAQIRDCRCEGSEDEDLVQEALMGLLAAVRTYRTDGGASFTTYATTCIRNRLLSVARSMEPRVQHERPMKDEYEPTDTDSAGDPDFRLQDREELDHLLHRLQAQLTPLEYQVLLLRLRHYSYAEIAAQLGITAKAVDNAIQRMRRKFV